MRDNKKQKGRLGDTHRRENLHDKTEICMERQGCRQFTHRGTHGKIQQEEIQTERIASRPIMLRMPGLQSHLPSQNCQG